MHPDAARDRAGRRRRPRPLVACGGSGEQRVDHRGADDHGGRPPRPREATTTTTEATTDDHGGHDHDHPGAASRRSPGCRVDAGDRRPPGPGRQDRQPPRRPAPGRPQPGRHRLRGDRRGHHPLRRRLPARPTPAPVGPIRSARTTDVDLLDQLNRPLFAWSGGNRNVVAGHRQATNAISLLATAPAPALPVPGRADGRTWPRAQPLHEGRPTLYTARRVRAGPAAGLSSATRPVGDAGHGRTARSPTIDVKMNSVPVPTGCGTPAQGLWIRSEYNGHAHVDAAGRRSSSRRTSWSCSCPTAPARPTPARRRPSPSGRATRGVFTDGKLIVAARGPGPTPSSRPCFTDADGQPVLLTPGRTWIELGPRPARRRGRSGTPWLPARRQPDSRPRRT